MTQNSIQRRGVFEAVVQDSRRIQEIGSVLSKHGMQASLSLIGIEGFGSTQDQRDELDRLRQDRRAFAVRARHVLEELGPTFIKLGQILSTRPDIVPPVFIEEFQELQDNAPTVSFAEIREQVEASFGESIESVFSSFTEEPLATASMAQVHRATLQESGLEVVVKVQRPGIEPQIRSDLALLYYLARFAEATIEEAGLYSPVAIIKEFEKAITEELNFLTEAENTKRGRQISADDPNVIVPEIIDAYTFRHVITQTFVAGKKLSSIEVGSERAERLSNIAMEAAFSQIFGAGFFHGDPHPGNMLVTDDDKVAFLDWGLVGRISGAQQDQMIDLLVSIIANDIDGITRIVLRMGYPEGRVNLRRLRRDVGRIRDGYLTGELHKVDVSKMMGEIMEAAHDHRIRVNPEYALLTKSLGTVEGILRAVYPELDIIETLRPWGQRLIKERYSGEALTRGAIGGLMSLNHLIRDVPMQLDQVLMDIEAGRLQVHVEHPALEAHQSAMTILGSRVFMGFLSGGLIVGGSILLATWAPVYKGWPVLPIVAGVLFVLAGLTAFAALSWHFVIGGIKKLRLTPWLRLFRRK